ncbi:MAG: T9SS type A sorting domain-containing protein, partial [Bacteroidota bacterium]
NVELLPEPATFSNVKIYEGSCGESTAVLENFDTRVDILGDQDEDALAAINIAPNPVSRGSLLRLIGGETELQGASYSIISMSGQVVSRGDVSGEATVNIEELNAGIYMLRLENGFTKVNKRFIVLD